LGLVDRQRDGREDSGLRTGKTDEEIADQPTVVNPGRGSIVGKLARMVSQRRFVLG
jgi:hypothetical protein